MTNFLGEILGMVAGTFESLADEYQVKTFLPRFVFTILDMAYKDEIAEPVEFGIGFQRVDGLPNIAVRKCARYVVQHGCHQNSHARKVLGIGRLEPRPHRFHTVGYVQEKVSNALE